MYHLGKLNPTIPHVTSTSYGDVIASAQELEHSLPTAQAHRMTPASSKHAVCVYLYTYIHIISGLLLYRPFSDLLDRA